MVELKPCPKCSGTRIGIYEEHDGLLWVCGIGCLTLGCSQGQIFRYAFRESRAFQKAQRAWNRKASNGTLQEET